MEDGIADCVVGADIAEFAETLDLRSLPRPHVGEKGAPRGKAAGWPVVWPILVI